MPYAVFLDIDNTLLSKKIGLPPENAVALQRFHDAGHYVFLNTGRTVGNLPRQALSELPIDGFVASLGSYVCFHGEVLASRVMDLADLRAVLTYFGDRGDIIVLEGVDAYIRYMRHDHPDREKYPVFLDETCDLEKELDVHKFSKVSITRSINPEEVEYLEQYYRVYVHGHYSETTFHGCSKGGAMLELCERIGVPRDRVIAMGDSNNDEEMLRAAGISVAMGNSDEYLKEIVTYVSKNCDDGGVADAIYHLLPELRP